MSIAFVSYDTASIGGTDVGHISHVPAIGNTLVVGVVIYGGVTVTVSQVFDDGGIDIFGNPLNTWQNLGTLDQGNGQRLELWGCCPVRAAITKVEIALTSNGAPNVNCYVAEYSGVATFASYGSVSNTGYNNLFFTGAAINNTNVLHVMFDCITQSMNMGSGNVPPQKVPITPAIQRGLQGGIIFGDQSVILKDELVAEVVTGIIPSEGLGAIGVVMNGGLSLSATNGSAPGFNDIDVGSIVAGTPGSPDPTKSVHAMTLAQIASNAALGMVRPEFFYTVQVDGDTVNAPISPVDSYQYQRDELIYIYTPITTFDPATGWTSGQGILFYCMWDVDPITGKVTSQEMYHPDGSSPINNTKDGQLLVMTIGQRAAGGIVMNGSPSLSNTDLTVEYQDGPMTQSLGRTLAQNSKFGAVKAEVFYMGEAVDGQQMALPSSTIDGYQYDWSEVMWMTSWLWTSQQNAFSPPPQGAHGGWSQLQRIEASVSSTGLVHCQVFFFNYNEIDPTASPNGGVAFGRVRVYAFCQRKKGPSLYMPTLGISEGAGSSTRSYVASVDGSKLNGKTVGKVSVSVPGGSTGVTFSKIVVKYAAHGTDTILGTTTLYSGGTQAQGPYSTPLVSYTLDPANDYYFIAVVTNGATMFTTKEGVLADSAVTTYNIASGVDLSTATTVSGMSLGVDVTYSRAFQSIQMTITGDTAAPGYADIPINAFMPGQPLAASVVSQLAKNVKTSAYAVEFFGVTNHANGDTIATPTSPTDGYAYSRQELLYIWQWHTTGNPEPRLWGFGCTIGANGVVNMMSWHVPGGGPIKNDTTGASIDVITIGVRSQITAAQTNNPGVNSGTPPPDFGSIDTNTGPPTFQVGGGS